MEAFLSSLLLVAAAEMGDRTQLLALALTVRYRAPMAVIAGIAVATLLNHLIAAAVGDGVASLLGPQVTRYVVGAGFLVFAVWALIPDRMEDEVADRRRGAFMGTAILFFFVEFGDKTQLATAGLAAQYGAIMTVAVATTFGLLAANVPVVLFGNLFAERLPMGALRAAAAALFALFGILTLLGIGFDFSP